MSQIRVGTVDVRDETALRQWWEAGRAAEAEREFAFWPAWEHSRRALPLPNPEHRIELIWARADDDGYAGTGVLDLPLVENLTTGFGQVYVRPEHRRRGVGSALLAELTRRAADAGRATLIGEAHTPIDGESAGSRFARAAGLVLAHQEDHKVLRLDQLEPRAAQLEAEVAAAGRAYRLVSWDTRTPQEYTAGLCRLMSGFMSQIPLGDLGLEDSRWTPQRLHDNEERILASGRRALVTAAVAPDGDLAGVSDLRISDADPARAAVGFTLVAQAHRGHRLGLALKLANHRALQEAMPTCEVVDTYNATVNEHMTNVNERLGYRVVEQLREFKGVL